MSPGGVRRQLALVQKEGRTWGFSKDNEWRGVGVTRCTLSGIEEWVGWRRRRQLTVSFQCKIAESVVKGRRRPRAITELALKFDHGTAHVVVP